MYIFLTVLAFVCVLISIAGSVLPALPGPPVAYIAIWLAHASRFYDFSPAFLLWSGVVMILIVIIDYILPPYITKKTGGSKYAATGSIIGMFIGMFFSFPGLFAGMLLGAFLGEWVFARKNVKHALKAAISAFAGFILGTGMKLLYCFGVLLCLCIQLFN